MNLIENQMHKGKTHYAILPSRIAEVNSFSRKQKQKYIFYLGFFWIPDRISIETEEAKLALKIV